MTGFNKLIRCDECGSVLRYRRRANDYACSYCPKTYTLDESLQLTVKPEGRVPRAVERTFDLGDIRIFNQPTIQAAPQAPQAATAQASQPSLVYHLRDDK